MRPRQPPWSPSSDPRPVVGEGQGEGAILRREATSRSKLRYALAWKIHPFALILPAVDCYRAGPERWHEYFSREE